MCRRWPGARPLGSVLEVRTRRRPFALELYGERVGELVLDETVIALGHERRRLRLTRVEVEVQPAFVDSDATPRRAAAPRLRPAAGDPVQVRGGPHGGGAEHPGTLPISGRPRSRRPRPSASSPTACCARTPDAMLAQAAGTRLGEDIEALHQMRVATRRMRAGSRHVRRGASRSGRAAARGARLARRGARRGAGPRHPDRPVRRLGRGDGREITAKPSTSWRDLLTGRACGGEGGPARGTGLQALRAARVRAHGHARPGPLEPLRRRPRAGAGGHASL